MDADAHFAALKRIRDTAEIPDPLPWVPREVLELIKWGRPDHPDEYPDRKSQNGHRIRAFSCMTLLSAHTLPESYRELQGPNQPLIQLLISLEALGERRSKATASFVASVLDQLPEWNHERAFFVVGLIWLTINAWRQISESELIGLTEWALEEEQRVRDFWGEGVGSHPDRWLFRITEFNLCSNGWITLGKNLDEAARTKLTGQGQTAVIDIAERIITGNG